MMRKMTYRTTMNGTTDRYVLTPYKMTCDAWSAGFSLGHSECYCCKQASADKEKRTIGLGMHGHGGKAVFRLVSPETNPSTTAEEEGKVTVTPLFSVKLNLENEEDRRIHDYLKENLELLSKRQAAPPNWRLTSVAYGHCSRAPSLDKMFDLMLGFCVQLPEHLRTPKHQCLAVEVVLDREQSSLPLEFDFLTGKVWDDEIDMICFKVYKDSSVQIAECKGDIVVRSLAFDAPTGLDKLGFGSINDDGEVVPDPLDEFDCEKEVTITEYLN